MKHREGYIYKKHADLTGEVTSVQKENTEKITKKKTSKKTTVKKTKEG